MVDGGADARARRAVSSVRVRSGESVAGARDSVSGLRSVAAAVAVGRATDHAGGVLAQGAGGSTGVARAADRSAASGAAVVRRRRAPRGAGRGADARAQGAESGAWDDLVHDGAGGLGGGAGATRWTRRCGDRRTVGEPPSARSGGADR